MTQMKKRKMSRWLERITAIVNDPTKHDWTVRNELKQLLGNLPKPKRTVNATTGTITTGTFDVNPRVIRSGGNVQIAPSHWVTNSDYASILQNLRMGKYIEAIRTIRVATGLGLKDSKDVADALRKNI